MATSIFINLCVGDLNKSKAFYTAIGFTINEQFTNEDAAGLMIAENINLMIMKEEFFTRFTKKAICNPRLNTECISCISVDSREAVDEVVSRAIAAGGSSDYESHDHGWMYYRTIEDLDGHMWEFLFNDLSQLPEQPATV